MKKLLQLFLFAILAISCRQQPQPGTVVIRGIFGGAQGQTLRLEELKPRQILPIDSAVIDKNGRFGFTTMPLEKGFYVLRTGNRNPIFLVLDKNDTVNLTLDTLDSEINYRLQGNNDSQLLRVYYQKTGETKQKIDSLRKVIFESQHLENFSQIKTNIDTALWRFLRKHTTFADSLIRNNPGSPASLLLINQSFSGVQLFNIEDSPQLHLFIDSALMISFPENSHVKDHHARVERYLQQQANKQKTAIRLSAGKKIPNITLPDVDGKKHRLDSLTGNNVVLFFWAAWSPECRADMQQLKILYEDYHNNDFEIYAISMDQNEKIWKAVVQLEKMKWINVSDGTGLDGPVSELFNLLGVLPWYFLVDKNGIIVTKTGDFDEIKNALIQCPASISAHNDH